MGKWMLINLKKNFFIHKAFIFKVICLFFFPPLLNENRVWGILQIIMFFNYLEFCIRILEDGPLWSSGENTRAFQKLYNYLFSLLLSLQYTHSNWKKKKEKYSRRDPPTHVHRSGTYVSFRVIIFLLQPSGSTSHHQNPACVLFQREYLSQSCSAF